MMASLLLSMEDANDDEDDESAVEDVTRAALVFDTNAVPEPWRRLLPLAVLRTGLNEYAEP
jgi:hypothetical protein